MFVAEGERYVNVTGVAPGKSKIRFLTLTFDQANRVVAYVPNATARDLMVWMSLLNASRVLRESEFQFTPRWRGSLNLDDQVVRRALQRLQRGRLIRVQFRRGKSPEVAILELLETSC